MIFEFDMRKIRNFYENIKILFIDTFRELSDSLKELNTYQTFF